MLLSDVINGVTLLFNLHFCNKSQKCQVECGIKSFCCPSVFVCLFFGVCNYALYSLCLQGQGMTRVSTLPFWLELQLQQLRLILDISASPPTALRAEKSTEHWYQVLLMALFLQATLSCSPDKHFHPSYFWCGFYQHSKLLLVFVFHFDTFIGGRICYKCNSAPKIGAFLCFRLHQFVKHPVCHLDFGSSHPD